MLTRVIGFSLANRPLVLAAALALAAYGVATLPRTPVDVFPDLNRPTVTVLVEAPGLAPEEVEALVARPLEYQLNGATGVRRVRSASAAGLAVVWAEFDWDTDVYRDRQIVAEKLQLARDRLPPGLTPVLAPVSSIMGEVMLLGVRSDGGASPMDLRTFAEWTLRNRLLAVDGVAQVTVMGGVLKQYQVVTTPARLAAEGVTLQQLVDAAEKANAVAGGGVLLRPARESLVRISGQSLTPEDIAEAPVLWRDPRPVRIKDVADVRFGGPVPRGDGAVHVKEGDKIVGGSAVMLAVFKQPDANTLALTPRIDAVLDELQPNLPPGVTVERRVFRQAEFIRTAVDNVVEAVRDGSVWVFVVLLVFLGSLRVSLITLTAIPLSLLVTLLVFRLFGVGVNTMTLGGLAVAVGELVDDAIVDVENIARRLRERSPGVPALKVVFDASQEVRGSVVYATLVVCLVVLPLFALDGLEGRMFAPLGLAYLLALLASLGVSLTVTPVLASYLLSGKPGKHTRDPLVLRLLKRADARLVRWGLRHPRLIIVVVMGLAVGSKFAIAWMGSEFLPPFNEGTLTVNVQAEPGTSLAESGRLAGRVELELLAIPEVAAVSRRTGRAEQDEHAEGVNSSDLEVRLTPHESPKPGWRAAVLRGIPGLHGYGVDKVGRPPEAVLADVRDKASGVPGVKVNIGQPISHRLDHVLSGVRAQVAVKVFGPDLRVLREAAADIQTKLATIPGVADLMTEPQVEVPQLRLRVNRVEAARHGLAPGDVARLLETAYQGRRASVILDGDRAFDLIVWFDESQRGSPAEIGKTILDTPSGRKVALAQVVDVYDTTGPNTLNREHVERRMAVACNVEGRDLGSTVADIRMAVSEVRLPSGYRVEVGGQFEAEQAATAKLRLFGGLAVVGVFVLLAKGLGSWRAAAMVLLVNIPLAALGSVVALLLLNRPDPGEFAAAAWWDKPRVWVSATTLSVAHWVGFITLIGIVCRNGILMISHYHHLMRHEGEGFTQEMIVRGSLERLAPVLMTAGVAVMGLVPLALGGGQPGKEILHPLAVVVVGGLIDSTLMDQLVTPVVFWTFGRKVEPDGDSSA